MLPAASVSLHPTWKHPILACGCLLMCRLRFGYSTEQLGPLPNDMSALTLARAIARGGPPMMAFRNKLRPGHSPIVSSRAPLRRQLVGAAEHTSEYFRETWQPVGRPRVTEAFRTDCTWVRAPFTVTESLPEKTNHAQVALAAWETALRGVEEHLTLSVFGCLPNVTWARMLANVFARWNPPFLASSLCRTLTSTTPSAHRPPPPPYPTQSAEKAMGEFNHTNYRQWAKCGWAHAHSVGPGELGCPWKDGASRLFPKAAAGIAPSKPMHDDNNGVLSLSCWTALTEADEHTVLVLKLPSQRSRSSDASFRFAIRPLHGTYTPRDQGRQPHAPG